MARWDRASGKITSYSDRDGAPSDAPTVFSEDRQGNLWIGFYNGGIARYRNGRFQSFTASDGLGLGWVWGIYPDESGKIWIATTLSGLYRVDEPQMEHPVFVHYSKTDGISSDRIYSVTGDKWGRIYLGTDRGLDRLDPVAKTVDHFTVTDGLPENAVDVAFRDDQDKLWFGTGNGLCSFVPEQTRPQPQKAYIGGIRIAGKQFAISELGESNVTIPELGATTNDLQIDFFAIGFATGNNILFQYRLENVDKDWSAPSGSRNVNYANLAPGSYRFLVRVAGTEHGLIRLTDLQNPSADLAEVVVYLACGAAMLIVTAYGLHLYHLSRVIELERVRSENSGRFAR